MHRAGADLVDVGGESTRPGAGRVGGADRDRAGAAGDPRPGRGRGAGEHRHHPRRGGRGGLEAGASVVNDVSGGLADPRMAAVVAAAGVPWILMHWRGPSSRMNELAGYEDVLGEVRTELVARVDAAVLAGVDPAPAGARPRARLRQDRRAQLGPAAPARRAARARVPGAGRGLPQAVPRAAAGRCRRRRRPAPGPRRATAAISALAACAGAWGVRVHDVEATMDALAVATAWQLGASAPADLGGPASSGDDRPDRAARADRARPPRRVRPRAARRAGLRRRPHGVAGPHAARPPPTSWPTPSTTARWPSARPRSSAASRAT